MIILIYNQKKKGCGQGALNDIAGKITRHSPRDGGEGGGLAMLPFPSYTIKCEGSMCICMSVTSTIFVNFFPQQKKKKKERKKKNEGDMCSAEILNLSHSRLW